MHLVIDRSGVVGVLFLAATIVLMSIATLWPDAANAQRMGDSNADRPMVPRPQGLDIYDNSGSGSESLSDPSEQPTGSGLTREEIIEIQQLLNEYDFSAGAADGIFGPKSSAAIKTFQTSIGLEVNGQLSLLLLQKLRSLRNASFRLNTNLRNTKTRALDGVSEPTIRKRVAADHLALSGPAAISNGVINRAPDWNVLTLPRVFLAAAPLIIITLIALASRGPSRHDSTLKAPRIQSRAKVEYWHGLSVNR